MGRVQPFFDQYRKAGRQQALEQPQVPTYAPHAIEFGVVLDEINDFERIDIFVVNLMTWPQVRAGLELVSCPAPIRQHHGKTRWRAVVEFLVLVANTIQCSECGDSCWCQAGDG